MTIFLFLHPPTPSTSGGNAARNVRWYAKVHPLVWDSTGPPFLQLFFWSALTTGLCIEYICQIDSSCLCTKQCKHTYFHFYTHVAWITSIQVLISLHSRSDPEWCACGQVTKALTSSVSGNPGKWTLPDFLATNNYCQHYSAAFWEPNKITGLMIDSDSVIVHMLILFELNIVKILLVWIGRRFVLGGLNVETIALIVLETVNYNRISRIDSRLYVHRHILHWISAQGTLAWHLLVKALILSSIVIVIFIVWFVTIADENKITWFGVI